MDTKLSRPRPRCQPSPAPCSRAYSAASRGAPYTRTPKTQAAPSPYRGVPTPRSLLAAEATPTLPRVLTELQPQGSSPLPPLTGPQAAPAPRGLVQLCGIRPQFWLQQLFLSTRRPEMEAPGFCPTDWKSETPGRLKCTCAERQGRRVREACRVRARGM